MTTTLDDSLALWADKLAALAQQPLTVCADFPTIAARHEAWWEQQLGNRPLFLATASTSGGRPVTRNLELLDDPQRWLEVKRFEVRHARCVGDSLPVIRVDFGPILLAGMFGGRREVGADTAWTHAFIDDDWSNAPQWHFTDDQPYWRQMRQLTQAAATEAASHCLISTPDLGNSGDVLLTLRGANGLCMDVATRIENVCAAAQAILPSWHRAYMAVYDDALARNCGLIHWLGLWSNRPYDVLGCDFSAMISPQAFETIFLPTIAQQACSIGRAVYHLDGPDAARHIDLLLEIPEIQAIQFSPGTGTPSALPWIAMFRKIQAHGRSLQIFCPAQEVNVLCKQLCPESLALRIHQPLPPTELDEVFAAFCRRF